MQSINHIAIRLGVFLLLISCTSCNSNRYAQFSGYAQGGTWGVKANLAGVRTSRAEIQRNIEAILEEIDTTLSGYNKSSQLSRLNAGDTIRPSAMFCEVYDAAWKFWQESDGALDCAAGPLYDIWGFGFKSGEMPSDEQVRQALAISGMKRLRPTMEEALREGRLWGPWLEKPGYSGNAPATADILVLPQLNFNAIAQGYSCDKVAAYLDGIGVKDMLVDIGEIWCRGLNPSGKPWRVGVDRPVDGNDRPGADMDGIWESGLLTGDGKQPGSDYGCSGLAGGQGIVTSGNYRKFYIRDGRKYSHTIDPRSGYPVGTAPSANSGKPGSGTLLSATIVAPTAMAADAYATYCMVIGFGAARDFIESRPDLEGYLIVSTGATVRTDGTGNATSSTGNDMSEWASAGFKLSH